MSLRDELQEIESTASESENLEELAGCQKRVEAILERVSKTLAAETDEEVRSHLQEIDEQGKETLREVKQRLADMRVELMDPDYHRRKAEKQQQEDLKKQRDMQEAKRFLAEGGLGNLFGGLFGGATAGPSSVTAPTASAAPGGTPPAPAAACGQCGNELKPGAKFCPECGTPVPREKHCSNCGVLLAPTARFCTECGTKAG